MADIKDVATVIVSALSEVGINGTLDVELDGDSKVVTLDAASGEAVEVVVTVTSVDRKAA